MSAISLAYCTFGLTALDYLTALEEVKKAGYPGVEITFHRRHFNPFTVTDEYLAQVRNKLTELNLVPACIATAGYFFEPKRPHEPSLMAVEYAARKRRIDLVKRGIKVARQLNSPLVTFGSGFIRAEHLEHPEQDPFQLLVSSIQECLAEIKPEENITLLLEPEPGMFIETMAEGRALVDAVNSEKFKLHIDLTHALCGEQDYVAELAKTASYARYLHVSDAPVGYNLKVVQSHWDNQFDLDFANYLVHFADTAEFLLLDKERPIYFYEQAISSQRQQEIDQLLKQAGIQLPLTMQAYGELYAGPVDDDLEDEIFTWKISVPKLSFDLLERTKPIVQWLRATTVDKRLANTLTGIAHFHSIPGDGVLDFGASFKALADNGYQGFAGVELYHHVEGWEHALPASINHLDPFVKALN